jgi:hypothetical protein
VALNLLCRSRIDGQVQLAVRVRLMVSCQYHPSPGSVPERTIRSEVFFRITDRNVPKSLSPSKWGRSQLGGQDIGDGRGFDELARYGQPKVELEY